MAHTGVLLSRTSPKPSRWVSENPGARLLSRRRASGRANEGMAEMIRSSSSRRRPGCRGIRRPRARMIEYPNHPGAPKREGWSLTDHGFSHVGLVCDDIAATAPTSRRAASLPHARIAKITGSNLLVRRPYGKFHPDEKSAAQLRISGSGRRLPCILPARRRHGGSDGRFDSILARSGAPRSCASTPRARAREPLREVVAGIRWAR